MPEAESQLSERDEALEPEVVRVLRFELTELGLGPDYPATALSAPMFHVAHARDPPAGRQVYLADALSEQDVDIEQAGDGPALTLDSMSEGVRGCRSWACGPSVG